jgi:hypothetical protein
MDTQSFYRTTNILGIKKWGTVLSCILLSISLFFNTGHAQPSTGSVYFLNGQSPDVLRQDLMSKTSVPRPIYSLEYWITKSQPAGSIQQELNQLATQRLTTDNMFTRAAAYISNFLFGMPGTEDATHKMTLESQELQSVYNALYSYQYRLATAKGTLDLNATRLKELYEKAPQKKEDFTFLKSLLSQIRSPTQDLTAELRRIAKDHGRDSEYWITRFEKLQYNLSSMDATAHRLCNDEYTFKLKEARDAYEQAGGLVYLYYQIQLFQQEWPGLMAILKIILTGIGAFTIYEFFKHPRTTICIIAALMATAYFTYRALYGQLQAAQLPLPNHIPFPSMPQHPSCDCCS